MVNMENEKKKTYKKYWIIGGILLVMVAAFLFYTPEKLFFEDEIIRNRIFNGKKSFQTVFGNGLVILKNQTLSTENPIREGDKAIVETQWGNLTITPENITTKGYYNVSSGNWLQKGSFEMWFDKSSQGTDKIYDVSNMNISIITEDSSKYSSFEAYYLRPTNKTKFYWGTLANFKQNDTVAQQPYNVTEKVKGQDTNVTYYKDLNRTTEIPLNNGTLINITEYYINHTYQELKKESVDGYDTIKREHIFVEFYVPYNATLDVFDVELCMESICVYLPQPLFTVDSQTDWNQGTYTNMSASSGGFLQLTGTNSTGSYESEIFDAVNTTSIWKNISMSGLLNRSSQMNINNTPVTLIRLVHLNNDSSLGEDADSFYDEILDDVTTTTCSNCGVVNATGFIDGGFTTDGANDYLDFGATALPNQEFSFAMWFNGDDCGESSQGRVFSDIVGVDFELQWNCGGNPGLRYNHDSTGAWRNTDFLNGAETIAQWFGRWHHIYFYYNYSSTANDPQIYIDGVLISLSEIGTPTSIDDMNNSGIAIGSNTAGSRAWGATIDEIMMFDTVLTQAQIDEIYYRGLSRLNLSVRSCNDASCSGETYSNKHKYFPLDLNTTITPNNRYFQYKIDSYVVNNSYNSLINITNEVIVGFENATAGDAIAPTYSNIAINTTIIGTAINFSSYWNDNVALDDYIFSTNNTGTWVNDTQAGFSGTPSAANIIKTLNDTVGIAIGYQWYANDTSDNWNTTGIQVLTTTQVSADCWTDITGGIYIPEGCTYYVPDGTTSYIT